MEKPFADSKTPLFCYRIFFQKKRENKKKKVDVILTDVYGRFYVTRDLWSNNPLVDEFFNGWADKKFVCVDGDFKESPSIYEEITNIRSIRFLNERETEEWNAERSSILRNLAQKPLTRESICYESSYDYADSLQE